MKSNDFIKRLYVVATPIGNLADMGLRAIELLGACELVLCENTQHSLRLFNHYGIKPKRIKKLTDHDSDEVIAKYLASCEHGDVALISDAGTPLISDPGHRLVQLARASGYGVLAVPGPSAMLAALSICSFNPVPFRFMGFLPRKQGERMGVLSRVQAVEEALVFYESPRRLLKLFADMEEVFSGDRAVFVVKELTKRFECTWHGALSEVYKCLHEEEIQGEFVVIVSGVGLDKGVLSDAVEVSIDALIDSMISAGISSHTTKQVLEEATPLRKNLLYNKIIARQRK